MTAAIRRLTSCLLVLAAIAHCGLAAAETNDHFAWDGYAGNGVSGGKHTGGLLLDGRLLFHVGVLRLGTGAQLAGLFSWELTWAGLLGLGLDQAHWHLALLGDSGVHSYTGVGAGFLSDDPGAGGTVPYAGARTEIGYIFYRGKRSAFGITTAFYANTDLSSIRRKYTYTEHDWLFDDSSFTQRATHTIGQTQLAASVGALWLLDLR
ncbi:MAG TPA: hypothetical protein VL137_03200 [Polyangiaceae bacterium]|nr:hypothetical protein [Polyangiaceae bacterium]